MKISPSVWPILGDEFGKMESRSYNFMHSVGKNRGIAAWSAHKNYIESPKKCSVLLSGPFLAGQEFF